MFYWLNKHKKDKFFLFAHCYDTHEPFIANPFLTQFEKEYSGHLNFLNSHDAFLNSLEYQKYKEQTTGYFLINKFYSDIINKKLIKLSREDIDHIRALYDNEIRYVDYFFSKFIKRLEQMELMENTIIILWSDHGEELLERGQIRHGALLYDEQIHVPLIIYIPGYKGPKNNKDLAQSIDIAPTILDILDLPKENRFLGIPLLSSDVSPNYFIAAQQKRTDALRTHLYKLLYHKKAKKAQLYNLKKDPGETTDISNKNREITRDLLKDLLSVLNKRKAEKSKTFKLDKQSIEKLKTLGYIK